MTLKGVVAGKVSVAAGATEGQGASMGPSIVGTERQCTLWVSNKDRKYNRKKMFL